MFSFNFLLTLYKISVSFLFFSQANYHIDRQVSKDAKVQIVNRKVCWMRTWHYDEDLQGNDQSKKRDGDIFFPDVTSKVIYCCSHWFEIDVTLQEYKETHEVNIVATFAFTSSALLVEIFHWHEKWTGMMCGTFSTYSYVSKFEAKTFKQIFLCLAKTRISWGSSCV